MFIIYYTFLNVLSTTIKLKYHIKLYSLLLIELQINENKFCSD